MFKRLFDLLVSTLVLVLLSPLLLVVAALIRRDGGRALYKGVRAGRDGTPFGMLKFRSMVIDADTLGPPSTANDDPRITKVGRFLRATKLDELPQLINVVRGEMSLVGPRPEVLDEVASYSQEQRAILSVKPGITDYSSIVFRNEGEILHGSADPHQTFKDVIQPQKIALGLRYVQTRSFLTDLRILGLTFLSFFSHDRAVRFIQRVPE